ncbi:putative ABC transport system permease protein [Duganella sp. CF458]|uniref:ABC transporter permease n=1 Tax=Duganella sp. CF458 TaxID=1884368 RepID=UPI0008E24B4E|nr:FtsX-like permease family protein [Duganella sp. CF458]SFF86184.1 putative ABC transport system permease protein [Duganella sp. CF458]
MMQWLVLAHRNVLRNGRRSLLLGGTIAIGTLALLLFAAYIAASLDGLRESTIRGGLGHAQIAAVPPADGYAEQQLQYGLDAADRARIEAMLAPMDGVRRVVPRLQFSGLVSNGPRTLNFEAQGVDPLRERQAYGAFQVLAQGAAIRAGEEGRYQVLIGKEMARRLGVHPGQSLTLMTTTVQGSVNAMDVDVVGIIATGIPERDLYTLQIPIETAQELLRTKKISHLSVLYQDTANADALSAAIAQALSGKVRLQRWQDLAPLYPQVMALFRNQFIVFGAIIGLIVFLGVAAMTLATIYERGKEIGTLRAMGIPQAMVRRLFMFEGLLQGAFGALAGGTAAWLATLAINAAGIELAPPPGRNVGVPLHLLWLYQPSLAIVAALPLLAMAAAWLTSRRIGRMPVKAILTSN